MTPHSNQASESASSSHSDHPLEPTLGHSPAEPPRGNLAGFSRYFKYDLVAGGLVFLIALPLCLGISLASGFPAIAGVFTAIVGSILTTFISNSELTIKGPAAGMIVIVLGAVTSFGYTGGVDPVADSRAYQMALAVGVVAGLCQVAFGMYRAGVLGDFFPTSAVHGMLAAIGLIIMVKQLPVAVGQSAKGEPLEIIRELPHLMMSANPQIAIIGGVSLFILFAMAFWKAHSKNRLVASLPAPLLVLLVAIPLGMALDLTHEHTYTMFDHEYAMGEQFLVSVPYNLLGAMAHPDFTVFMDPVLLPTALKWVVMFALIGSLESLLSAKAVDMLDPYRRKTNLNRDLVAVGFANLVVSFIGGLPMISEIVRSKANIDNQAKTRFADMWHGLFLLGFVAFLPALIHRIPLASLAAMLVFTGFRLASPSEFLHVYRVGKEQLVIFVTTIVAVLATDLLIGIGIGIATKFAIHCYNGVSPRSWFVPDLDIHQDSPDHVSVRASQSAVFSNWISFRRQLVNASLTHGMNCTLDFTNTHLVDHSVMENLHELQDEFHRGGLKLDVIGLENHKSLSDHPMATRKLAESLI
ncbi:SulP family inorganic anion transporter [Neorhodopirellula pilleata]|uniref:C4-dicarboxylic acid transporter DauA n=1 Tax=Neorhodopirellula pilleata TaxID=2714738 RepID=A0A5C6AVX2_9BACT|nr:SulP family inorganic anion transporter [Neorhodopirellula pilleata]TWU03216.1 C4-dicarboxylic acid transporter DauA [Neorhodopirellula pilleata]